MIVSMMKYAYPVGVGFVACIPWYIATSGILNWMFAFKPLMHHPLLLSTFKIYKTVKDDKWNKKPSSEYHCRILAEDKNPDSKAEIKEIGHFNYRATVGQVGGIYLHPEYRGRLLREQVLIYMMKDMLEHGATHIWETSPPEGEEWISEKHYTDLWDFEHFQINKLHASVTGGGYKMPIPSDPRELVIKIRELPT